MTNFSPARNRAIIIGGAAIIILTFVFVFYFGSRGGSNTGLSAKLTFWGVYDDNKIWAPIIDEYRKNRSNIQVTYEEHDPATYESDLVNALAAGKGPDVFMFHNTWLPKHLDKITPVNEQYLPYATVQGLYPQVVMQDFTADSKVYALPLYLDTLALYYNKDWFDRKAIAFPPATWTDFETDSNILKEVDKKSGAVIRAGAAMGGTEKSVNRATDILSLLMLQSGAQMVNKTFTAATFSNETSQAKSPGLDSLDFYTKFANPASPVYTWNDNLHYSVDNFAEGTTAMMLNYGHQASTLKSKNPYLNFGIAPVPQITGTAQPVAYANYWGLAVSEKTPAPQAAWDFVAFVTTSPEIAKSYADNSKKPPALKSLLSNLINDPDWQVFAKQALIARSWPEVDNNAVEKSFSNMIGAVISGELPEKEALKRAEDEITLLMRRK